MTRTADRAERARNAHNRAERASAQDQRAQARLAEAARLREEIATEKQAEVARAETQAARPKEPRLPEHAPVTAVLRAAGRWAVGRYGDDSVAAGVAMRIARQHGVELPIDLAHRLVRGMRARRRMVPA